MPPLYHVGGTALCPHGGQVTVVPTNTRVLVSGQPVAIMSDTFTVAACVFQISGAPHPCVLVKFIAPATRVMVNGAPAILQTSAGLAQAADQAPQGPPSIVVTQVRVQGM
jgi:uncharacterized Zn-binding protein involved in type VI secretion